MGFRDKFKSALGSGNNEDGDSKSQDGAKNFKHIAKLMIDNDYVVLDSDIVSTGFERRLYKEGIPLLDNIVIDGAGHTIDAQGLTRIFFIKEKNIILKNITFKNGSANGGGAIAITNSGSLEIKDCTFADNYSKQHGGAIINFGKLKLENVDFINNSSKEQGGAINNQIGAELSFSNCSFKENSAEGGGAIVNFGPAVITESNFENNNSNKHAGAIYNTNNGDLNISKTIFMRNTASGDAGAINNNTESSNLEVDDCKFIDNRAGIGGGAIVNFGSSFISNSEFQGNFSKKSGYDINFQKGNINLLNVKFNYIKEKSIYSTNDDLVKIENCEFSEYDD